MIQLKCVSTACSELTPMPKRSNEFQRLVFYVQRALASADPAEESAYLVDRATGKNREVDVCIHGKVGDHDVLVSVECRDHARRADVGWVEQMAAKHERLATNALILASKSGFSASALKVAEYYNAKTVSFDEIEKTDFGDLLGASSSLWAKKVIASAEKVVFVVQKVDGAETERVVVSRDNYLHKADGEVICLAEDLVNRLLRSALVRDYLLTHGDAEHSFFTLQWDVARSGLTTPIYMRSLKPSELRAIQSVELRGPCSIEIQEFSVRQAQIDDVIVAWGEPSILGQDAIIVSVQDPDKGESLALSIDGTDVPITKQS